MAASTSASEDHLECLLCLDRFQKPKLLPCHHTFCQECLVNLIDKENGNEIKCPQCRKRLKLTTEDVPKLQTNFYLLPYLESKERQGQNQCPLHPGEDLRFLCTSCGPGGGEAACCQCVLGPHKGHDLQDLAKASDSVRSELRALRTGLDEVCGHLSSLLASGQQHHQRAQLEQQSVVCILQQRARELHGLVETRLSDALAALRKIMEPIDAQEKSLEAAYTAATEVQRKVEAALLQDKDNNYRLLRDLVGEVSAGRGSQGVLQQARQVHNSLLLSGCPTLRCMLEGQHGEHVGRLLGQVCADHTRICLLSQYFSLARAFRCGDNSAWGEPAGFRRQVFALYSTEDEEVWVAYASAQPGPGGQGMPQEQQGCQVARYGKTGHQESCAATVAGRVCLAGLSQGWVRVEGRFCHVSDVYNSSSLLSACQAPREAYDIYNKARARCLLRLHANGRCELRALRQFGFQDVFSCRISARRPLSQDISADGRLLAVVEEEEGEATGRTLVALYRCKQYQPFAKLRYRDERPLRPTDVCFFKVGPLPEQRLVVSDSLNDALLVLAVEDGNVSITGTELVRGRNLGRSISHSETASANTSRGAATAAVTLGNFEISQANTSDSRRHSETSVEEGSHASLEMVAAETLATSSGLRAQEAAISKTAAVHTFPDTTTAICPQTPAGSVEPAEALSTVIETDSGHLTVVEEIKLSGKPTALCPDTKGRLWVGLEDGTVLTLTPTASFCDI